MLFIKNNKKIFFLIVGLACFSLILMLPEGNNFNYQIISVIGITALMFIWWISESLPIAITSLVPICLFPLFDIMPVDEVTKYYSNKIIYLMLSGFLLGIALQKWRLNYRIALNILRFVGNHPSGVLLGFMITTALLSMWVSNTATSIIMLPVALSFLSMLKNKGEGNFSKVLILSIAYAASIGGMGTIIGTPTNAVLIAHLSEVYNIDISFAKWLLCFFPLVIILIISMWVYLSIFQLKNVSLGSFSSNDFVQQKLQELGKMTYEERAVSIIFALLASLWIFKSYLPATVSDSAIGIGCCSLFFIINAKDKEGCLLNWDDTKKLPWGILILFGGGMALAKGLEKSGVIDLVTLYFDYLQIKNVIITIVFFTVVVIIFTEMMSNMALITILVPILSIVSISLTGSPFTLAIPATLAASCAFMLPMATPPNAIILSSGHVTMSSMIKIGFLANLIAAAIIISYSYFISGHFIH